MRNTISSWSARGFLGVLLALTELVVAGAPVRADGEHQTFSLGDFPLESGETLRDGLLSYVTHGEIAPERDNVVLLPSWFTGDHHGYDFLIGAGLALDLNRYFIVATDMFANGLSSSPSNAAPGQRGAEFPQVSIRDNVAATKRLLEEQFGIRKLYAVVGFSMGAQQAFQWAVVTPDWWNVSWRIAVTPRRPPLVWCGWRARSALSRPTQRGRKAATAVRRLRA